MDAVRNGLTWVLTAPLLAVGVLAGHSLGYTLAVSDAHERAHTLDQSGHAYLDQAPLVVAICLTLAAGAFASRVVAVAGGRRGAASTPAWIFAALPPLAFLAQEYGERVLHSGEVDWATGLQPAVLLGLSLQLPIALAVLSVARALAALADAVGRSLAPEPRRPVVALLLPVPVPVDAPLQCGVHGRGWSQRGPPHRL
jgi:hypothetical protein